MFDMVLTKGRDEEVGVVIILEGSVRNVMEDGDVWKYLLISDVDAIDASILDGFFKIFRQQLAIFVEVVASALM